MKPTHPLPKLVRFEPAFWIPEPYQSLDGVISSVYGLTPADGIAYPAILEYVQALNPTVFNTRSALGKRVVRLIDIQTRSLDDLVCSDSNKVIKQLKADFVPLNQIIQAIENDMPTNKKELESYRVMLGMLDYLGAANNLTGVGLGMLGNLAGTGLQREIQSQLDLLTRHKRGVIPQSTYKAQQAQSLKRIRESLGWTEKYMFGGKTTRQALFTPQTHGIKAQKKLLDSLKRVKFLSKASTRGGVLLTGAGVALSCMNIAEADKSKKMEVAYQEIGGTFAGVSTGLALGFLTLSGPMGWGVALLLSAATGYGASAAGSYLAGKIYQNVGDYFNLNDSLIINKWCK